VTTPVVYQYQQALDEFRREGREPPLLKRMSELISLLDLTTTLGSSLSGGEILDAALLIVMGELQVSRGGLWVAAEGEFRRRAARGLPAGAPESIRYEGEETSPFEPAAADALVAGAGVAIVCPVRRAGRTIALLGLGPRAAGAPFGREERGFLESLAACAAIPIENGLIYEELRQVNRSLTVKVFQLHNLFDISRELTGALDEAVIERLVVTTVMGQFLSSRCALWRQDDGGVLRLVHARGLRAEEAPAVIAADVAAGGPGPVAVAALPDGPSRDALAASRLALAVPLVAGGRASGLLVVGEKPAGRPFVDEDLDFAAALARQAQAALEGARLHRMQLEKERQDRELQIAREIQQNLFPRDVPNVPGFDLAAVSRSCYEVGGDYFDFIPLPGGRLAVVIADVSGKGTPASIMMASVHASLQAMAGTAPPAETLLRLNRFLYENTQTSRYVTLFYGELDPAKRTLSYVNAGHVPPFLLRGPDAACERLRRGGPVIGLLEEIELEPGEVCLEPGDLMAVVTDGATEAVSPAGEELTDARIVPALVAAQAGSAADALRSVVATVDAWTGSAGCTDDLTVLTLRAT
jgi:sigma-B regulation protein RsbU (phosphoserine phosphatase)